MKRIAAMLAIAVGLTLGGATPAFAWHITPDGSATCQESGTYLVTFTYTSSNIGETVTWDNGNPMTVPGDSTSASNTAHAVWPDTYTLNSLPNSAHNIVSHDNGTADVHDDYWTYTTGESQHQNTLNKYTKHAGETDTKSFTVYLNGDCKPPVDLCPNIEGNQAEVPEGYEVNNDGQCVPIPPPPTDVCPNIEGVQQVVPEGLIVDDEGNCVTPPTETPPPPVPPKLDTFIFSTCDLGTFIRFEGVGNAYYSVDGVFTDIAIAVDPTDVQLGSLPNGTVVTAAFNGGDVRTLTVDLSCPVVVTPQPPVPPTPPVPHHHPWHPTWSPAHPTLPTDLAFTGANVVKPTIALVTLLSLGLGSLLWLRKRYRVG